MSVARYRNAPPAAIDLAVAALSALAVCVTAAAAQEEGARSPDFTGYVLAAAIAAPLLARRRWPVAVLIASAVLLQVYYAADYPAIGVAVPLAAAIYTAVRSGHVRAGLAVVAVLELVAIVYRALAEDESLISVIGLGTVADVSLIGAVILLAEALRSREALRAESRRRVAAVAREREREAERRVDHERIRIARELHDVLAHTIAVINVQAGVAADALAEDSDQTRESLRVIRDKSREAIAEVKVTLGVLRDDDGSGPGAPMPSLADLDELVASMSGAELSVELSISGRPRPLPPAIELTAYRVV
jgi:signal transduction histidine kinase